MKTRALVFQPYTGKDIAPYGGDGDVIKHITWMGVVCMMDDIGRMLFYMHGPS